MAKCVLCGILGESTIHLIRDCAFAKCVWLATPIGIPPSPPYALSMLDWILNWTSYLNLWNFALGLMVLWEIWGARNNGLWNDRMDSPDIIAARGLSWWQEFQRVASPALPETRYSSPSPS